MPFSCGQSTGCTLVCDAHRSRKLPTGDRHFRRMSFQLNVRAARRGGLVANGVAVLIGMMVGTDGVKRSVAKVIPTAMLYKRLFLELGR